MPARFLQKNVTVEDARGIYPQSITHYRTQNLSQ
jgi:hypothetical protein